MVHTRLAKKKGKLFERIAIHDLDTKLGKFEIEEFKSFYVVRKKLQHPSQKGFYDPTAMVVAKTGKIPFLPSSKFTEKFVGLAPFFFYRTGIKGKDDLYSEMDKLEKGQYIFPPIQKYAIRFGDIIYEKTHRKKVKKK